MNVHTPHAMREYIELGPVPHNEECTPVRKDGDYLPAMKAECLRHAEGLANHFAPVLQAHPSLRFSVKSFPHEFGTYCEAVVSAPDNDDAALSAAWGIQDHLPGTWNELENSVSAWMPEHETAEHEESAAA